MASDKVQIYSVEKLSGNSAVCIVRCVGGVVRVGQALTVEVESHTADSARDVTLTALVRYGRNVDFFDPPHAAKVHLSGPGAPMLEPGMIITGRG
ncbi:hypothetical protein DWB77_03220 [Streptomyces hundungensis]|uniref:Uncharacterized protein n=1 Tax=Streptomyces hundungensis TaxID=1077946 RepID=A0A387HJS4_9ACTN|nr:hypothetical protein [Streptomyces hundungensis]AYG81082.1 hypothetical protein DWB77_03220 [Streptomyces hundungensis]